MTYKLEPGLSRIVSPLILIFPDGGRMEFENGAAACAAVFDHRYVVREIRAAVDTIEIKVEEMEMPGGEVTFF